MRHLGCPIDPYDEVDFYLMVKNLWVDPTRFENHWPYIIQATRGLGYVYKEEGLRIYSYIRDGMLVAVNCFGENCAKIIKEHAIKHNIDVCIKNIAIEDLAHWEMYGFVEKQSDWSEYSIRDDNSYPECIYALTDVALAHLPLKAGEIRKCRASHSNRLRQFLRERNIRIEEYIKEMHEEAVKKLLLENAKFLESKGVDSVCNVLKAHEFVFDEKILNRTRLVHVEDNELIGLNHLTIVENSIFGNAIIHKNETNLMRFLVWQGFNYLYKILDDPNKYFVTMQGSEQIGQYHWKKGFTPLKETAKTHLIYLAALHSCS